MRTLLVALLLVATARGAGLGIGDPAPAARPKAMLKGEPVGRLDDDKTYLFEFWATWCGPCVAMVPHLAEVHRAHADHGLVILSTAINEKDPAKAAAFVRQRGDGMPFRVGLDADGAMERDWLVAAGQGGIPVAFAVHRGKITWIGNPAELCDAFVASLLDGTYDHAKAEASQRRAEGLLGKASRALVEKRWDDAEKALGEALPLVHPGRRQRTAEHYLERIELGRGQPGRIYRRIAGTIERDADLPGALLFTAHWLLNDPIFEGQRDLALAERAAQRVLAIQPAGSERASALDALARIRFLQGKRDEAVELERQAMAIEGPAKTAYARRLEDYRQGRLPAVNPGGDDAGR